MSAVHLPLPKMAGRYACNCFISSVKAGASSRSTNVSEFSFTRDQSKSQTTKTLPSPLSAASDAPAQRESHIVVLSTDISSEPLLRVANKVGWTTRRRLALSERGQDGRCTDFLCVCGCSRRGAGGAASLSALRLPAARAERPRHRSRVAPGSYPCVEGWFGLSMDGLLVSYSR